ncbi:suppressor of fused domain protein [Paenibacillus sp. FSL R5-0713]|uniref:suppressor of fused domain protein n=1 Tax=Paenibacillus sp. FSL R5-0713 TaxID=2921655 RepID=UPI0030DD5FD9
MAWEQLSKQEQFSMDIRRTFLLGSYINEWGMPELRTVLSKPNRGIYIEIYYFPPTAHADIARFATVGLSQACRPSGEKVASEWMLALQSNLGGECVERVNSYMADLISHHIENVPDSTVPRVMTPSELAPSRWTVTAFLLDELRGESESLEQIYVGHETIPLLWAIPITSYEANLLLSVGLDEFDAFIESSEHSIIDPCRP